MESEELQQWFVDIKSDMSIRVHRNFDCKVWKLNVSVEGFI